MNLTELHVSLVLFQDCLVFALNEFDVAAVALEAGDAAAQMKTPSFTGVRGFLSVVRVRTETFFRLSSEF